MQKGGSSCHTYHLADLTLLDLLGQGGFAALPAPAAPPMDSRQQQQAAMRLQHEQQRLGDEGRISRLHNLVFGRLKNHRQMVMQGKPTSWGL